MTRVDDLLERRAKQVVLAIVARLARQKTRMHTRLSCKIDYLLRSNHRDRSIASEFFTDDGDTQAIKELADRLDGKPAQMLEHSSPDSEPITKVFSRSAPRPSFSRFWRRRATRALVAAADPRS